MYTFIIYANLITKISREIHLYLYIYFSEYVCFIYLIGSTISALIQTIASHLNRINYIWNLIAWRSVGISWYMKFKRVCNGISIADLQYAEILFIFFHIRSNIRSYIHLKTRYLSDTSLWHSLHMLFRRVNYSNCLNIVNFEW